MLSLHLLLGQGVSWIRGLCVGGHDLPLLELSFTHLELISAQLLGWLCYFFLILGVLPDVLEDCKFYIPCTHYSGLFSFTSFVNVSLALRSMKHVQF